MTHVFPGWFQPHHDSVEDRLNQIQGEIRLLLQATERLIKMADTADQALGELAALEQAQAAALAKLQADVTAALARIQTGGPLTAAQQAEVDALKGAMAADTATVDAIDASTQPAPPAV
jgi:hypothetical protein